MQTNILGSTQEDQTSIPSKRSLQAVPDDIAKIHRPISYDVVDILKGEVIAIRDLLEHTPVVEPQPRGWKAFKNKLLESIVARKASRYTMIAGALLILLNLLFRDTTLVLIGFALLYIGMAIEIILSVWEFAQTIKYRRIEALKNSRAYAEQFDRLFYNLLPYSRAALLKVADDLTTFDTSVDKRVSTILGQGRAGLLTVLTFAVAGYTALQKVLESNTIPANLHEPFWWLFLTMLGMALAAVAGRHSVNSATTYAALLRQVATIKETLEKEDKEERERRKDSPTAETGQQET